MSEVSDALLRQMMKGGPRTSVYSEPVPKKKKETWLQRQRREAAEFKAKRIDSIAR
jgi:hypothetical protein